MPHPGRPATERHPPERMTTISPFAAIVEPDLVQAAAERAAKLDLPRRRSESWLVRDEDDEEDMDALMGLPRHRPAAAHRAR